MATYHAQPPGRPIDRDMPSMKTTLQFRQDVSFGIAFEQRSNFGIDRAARVIPASIREREHAMWNDGLIRSLERNVARPNTLTHSDVRIGNRYVTGLGRMGLTDWQCAAIGNGVIDLSHALMPALTGKDRRTRNRELIASYADRPAEQGLARMTRWTPGRHGCAIATRCSTGSATGIYTIGAGEMQPADISLVSVERMAAAIDDHDSLTLLDR